MPCPEDNYTVECEARQPVRTKPKMTLNNDIFQVIPVLKVKNYDPDNWTTYTVHSVGLPSFQGASTLKVPPGETGSYRAKIRPLCEGYVTGSVVFVDANNPNLRIWYSFEVYIIDALRNNCLKENVVECIRTIPRSICVTGNELT